MNDILFSVLQVCLIALLTAIARYLIPYLTAKLRKTKFAFAAEIVENAVLAAEQMISGSGQGSRKFEQAMSTAQDLCKKYNINLTEEQICMLIESAVGVLNQDKIEPCIAAPVNDFQADKEEEEE